MNITITPGKLTGSIHAIPSKSQAHRLLICSAFANAETELICTETSADMNATVDCLRALGAHISQTARGYRVIPIQKVPGQASLPCRESGSTLRFLLPVVGALGVDATFCMEGRLPQRPLTPLWEEMERMGCTLSRPSASTLRCTGKLKSGDYTIAGNVSSQFITGLLFALSLCPGRSQIHITGMLESVPYIIMTQKAMELFGIGTSNFQIQGGQTYRTPGCITVEGDWSNGAFFLAANALGSQLDVQNLNPNSPQGDRAIARIFPQLKEYMEISAADIPDLIPILAVYAGANKGASFTNIQRLRLKESDRVASVVAMIRNLGGSAEATEDTLRIYGTGLTGGTVDSVNDHRIAMAAAIASTVCTDPVTILDAQAVNKSYPRFWEEFLRLGGHYEQHIR